MRYLRKFNSHSSYVSPNVSVEHKWDVTWCRLEKDVHYKAYHDYSLDYFTLVALEDNCEFSIIFDKNLLDNVNSVSYSLDNGQTWTTIDTSTGNYNGVTVVLGTVNINLKILVKGDAVCYAPSDCTKFAANKLYKVEGNIMSLLYGDLFKTQYILPTNTECCFYGIFYDSTNLISAKNLILPATTLTADCYNQMFQNCTNLMIAPELPATTLAPGCYAYMFYDCTNLVIAPELPAITLVDSCYEEMFDGCTSLNYIKCLAEDKTALHCTYRWVRKVAATGTFVKASGVTWPSGTSGIPEGWTVLEETVS